jgi:hypothetical protein
MTFDMFISTLPPWMLFLLIVCIPVAMSYAGLLLIRRVVKKPKNIAQNDVAGFIFAAVSVIYAVLLGFLVITVWEEYGQAEQAATNESSALIAVAHDSILLPSPARAQMDAQLRKYIDIVTHNEWRTGIGLNGDPQATVLINNMWKTYSSTSNTRIDTNMIAALNNLSEQRANRLLANDTAVPLAFWIVLIVGAMITISFCFVLQMEDMRAHASMTALLVGVIGTCLWIVVLINHPFVGTFSISSDTFEHALYVINSIPK